MKFVKENLTLVICGVVLLLVLVWAFVPGVPYTASELAGSVKTELKERIEKKDAIAQLKIPLSLPGMPENIRGVPNKAWIAAKQNLIKSMDDQQKLVSNQAHQLNMLNRYDAAAKVPIMPLPSGPRKLQGFLPVPPTDTWSFKDMIAEEYQQWTGMLTQDKVVKVDTTNTVPPRLEDIKAELEQRKVGQPLVGGGGGVGQDDEIVMREAKRQVTDRAKALRMYVEPGAFQIRPWFVSTSQPSDVDIFNGLVESWFQSDVVKAIVAVNQEGLAREVTKNVGKSPVKRLTRIVVALPPAPIS